ncbi:MAG: cell filamentation protein Fic, partial [Prevotella sp.]|nr:cell filamentation protein Fic [Prevotella sp.]
MEKSAILEYLKTHPGSSSSQIADALANEMSLATVKRILSEYVKNFYVYTEGRARATKYFVSPLFLPVDLNEYFDKEVDERQVQTGYNF